MHIARILNNNVAIALNARGQECVVMGKGVAYGKKPGDKISVGSIEKMFSPKEKGVAEKLSRIVESVPLEHVRVCDEIINMAQQKLGAPLKESIYLTLIDHISFTIVRHNDGVNLTSGLVWEMKQFYPHEYAVGLEAIRIIQKRLNISLPKDEAAFITFHLVNARPSGNIQVQESLELIRGVLAIVQQHFSIEFNKDSLTYNRFLTHLKFFSLRVLDKGQNPIQTPANVGLLPRFTLELPGETACAVAIGIFVQSSYGHTLSDDEKTYLIIHIHTLLTR